MLKLSRAFHEKSSEISLCSIILNLAEDTNVIFEQKATYPANMFISDIGGSAGLILGKSRVRYFIYSHLNLRNKFSINNSMFDNSFQLHAEEIISTGKSSHHRLRTIVSRSPPVTENIYSDTTSCWVENKNCDKRVSSISNTI